MRQIEHLPVMPKEVVAYLNCKSPGIYADVTVGMGGHALEILKASSPDGVLIGIDCDQEAISASRERLNNFAGRIILVKNNFIHLRDIMRSLKIEAVDGILFDLGISSLQLAKRERGFSFNLEGPLDMRMDQGSSLSAFDIVNQFSESQLKKIFWDYAEERFSRKIARSIVEERKKRPVANTKQLASIIESAVPVKYRFSRIHPATRTFQALRIAANDELNNIQTAIEDGINLLKRGGRFCVISFHSLEDRIVKKFLKFLEKECVCPPHVLECRCNKQAEMKILTKKPILPTPSEIKKNPRSRSAKLRAGEKL